MSALLGCVTGGRGARRYNGCAVLAVHAAGRSRPIVACASVGRSSAIVNELTMWRERCAARDAEHNGAARDVRQQRHAKVSQQSRGIWSGGWNDNVRRSLARAVTAAPSAPPTRPDPSLPLVIVPDAGSPGAP
jgi:hypothetical protein